MCAKRERTIFVNVAIDGTNMLALFGVTTNMSATKNQVLFARLKDVHTEAS